jgi:hypothetical protein
MLAAVLAPAATGETTNMIGGQSQNVGIPVVPAPGKVTIDGDLKDWDLSGRVWAFADKSIRSRYSAEVAMMWDAANLYVAIHWKDPTPMFNLVDPAFNPSDGCPTPSSSGSAPTASPTSPVGTICRRRCRASRWRAARA